MLEVMDVIWVVLAIAACVGLAWLGLKIEPHWVSKDGHRFLCNAQLMNVKGDTLTGWRETRVIVHPDGQAQVDQKRMMRRNTSIWRISARAPEPPRGKVVYLLKGHDTTGKDALLAIRLPVKSRAREALDPFVPNA